MLFKDLIYLAQISIILELVSYKLAMFFYNSNFLSVARYVFIFHQNQKYNSDGLDLNNLSNYNGAPGHNKFAHFHF